MTRIEHRNCIIRCWREEVTYDSPTRHWTEGEIMEVIKAFPEGESMEILVPLILKIDRMNAVEVTNQSNGAGMILYKLNPDGTF